MNKSTFNGRNAHISKENAMKRFNLANVVAAFVASIALTACGDDLTGNVADTTIGLEVRGSALCVQDPRPDEAFCPDEIEIPAVLPTGYASSGEQTTDHPVIKVTIDASTNVGFTTVDLPSDMLDEDDNGVIYLATADLDLPTGYRLQKCGAEGDASTITIVAGTGCLAITYTGDDTTNGNGPQGSGTGSVTIGAQHNGDEVSDCTFNFNSNQLDDACVINADGADCDDVAAGEYRVDVSCNDGELVNNGYTFAVIEDEDTAYTVDVDDPASNGGSTPTRGKVLISVSDSQGDPLDNCTFDFLQLTDEPMTSDAPSGTDCDSADGCYYFAAITAGRYDVVATCGSLDGQRDVTVVAGSTQHVWMTLYEDIPDGQLCVGKLGLPIDLDTSVASLQMWVGYGVEGACEAATDSQYAGMTVVELSGPDCDNLSDASCAVSPLGGANDAMIGGEHPHLLWTVEDFSSYGPTEQKIFALIVEDENGDQVTVYLDTLNGYFQ